MGGASSQPPGTCLSDYCGAPGVYGVLEQAAAGNVPGSRQSSVSWTDPSGNLWLFGGNGFDANNAYGYLNDLWEFNPATRTWAWISGSSTVPTPSPGDYYGQPGLYGTLGTPSAANVPGGREGAHAWTDAKGKLWLFGGYGFDSAGNSGYLNDLWEFDPSARTWVWMGGSDTVPPPVDGYSYGQPGVYGTLGRPAAGNYPGGRIAGLNWTDSKGDLWLFGGASGSVAGTGDLLDDLWEFNTTSGLWAWMGGSSTVPCETGPRLRRGRGLWHIGPASRRQHPGRPPVYAAGWIDANDNIWIYGGLGCDANDYCYGFLGDLWTFNPVSNSGPG